MTLTSTNNKTKTKEQQQIMETPYSVVCYIFLRRKYSYFEMSVRIS